MKRKVTRGNIAKVWISLTGYVAEILTEHPEAVDSLCRDVNEFCEILDGQDAFGTEGQNDPRGDQRD